jgi:hypothetical protein
MANAFKCDKCKNLFEDKPTIKLHCTFFDYIRSDFKAETKSVEYCPICSLEVLSFIGLTIPGK